MGTSGEQVVPAPPAGDDGYDVLPVEHVDHVLVDGADAPGLQGPPWPQRALGGNEDQAGCSSA